MDVLSGIRVLDFGRYIAGPFCAALLGDLGADVIRVERVDGGEDRFVNPMTGDGTGAMFLQMGRNKRSLTLNPLKPEGAQVARNLIATADVVIANLPPQTLSSMGLDYETLCSIKPNIILTTVTAFGRGGPWDVYRYTTSLNGPGGDIVAGGASVAAVTGFRLIADHLAAQAGIDAQRPAVQDLNPQGDWMAWANDPARQLPDIPYYNAYGSIEISLRGCAWLLGCHGLLPSVNLGDGVIPDWNNPDPYDGPSWLGGTRFNPANGQSFEWEIRDTVHISANALASNSFSWDLLGLLGELNFVPEMQASPVFHSNIPSTTDVLVVESCGSGAPVVLANEVIDLIENRSGAGGFQC